MINISNCPDTGLKRKITAKDFYKFESVQQVILRCHISHYNQQDEKVENARVKSYYKDLVASDLWCDATTGALWTPEQVAEYKAALQAIEDWNNSTDPEKGPQPPAPEVTPITEYEYFISLTTVPIIMEQMELSYISTRDQEGKFNI